VALIVGLKHLDKTPVIYNAEVVWGHPSGSVEADILTGPVEFSAERLEEIVERLPELLAGLQRAIRRGHPAT
jgi:hypothetical protein